MNYIRGLNIIFIGIIAILFWACNSSQEKLSKEEIIKRFYNGLNNSDFEEIKKYTTDNFMILWGDNFVINDWTEIYGEFLCDSVFSSKIEILTIKSRGSAVELTLSKNSKRIEFLHDTAFSYKVLVEVSEDQIAKIELKEYVFLNLEKFQTREDSLVAWIVENHPELEGFEKDKTIKGAQNFLKAIELFNNKQ